MDRLKTRNLRDWVTLDDLDLTIHFVKENTVISRESRSNERLVHGIKVLLARQYVDNLSEETRKGMVEKAEQGLYPSYAPLGYRNALAPDGKRIIEPDPERAPIITRTFERYATGEYSVSDVARMARADGLRYPKSGKPVPRAEIHSTLRKRIYTGVFDWSGCTYQGTHEPLVSVDLYDQVQAVLASRSRRKPRRSKHDFAFARLVTCGHCGCALSGERKKGRYVYYRCSHFKRRCPDPYVREEALAEQFGELLAGLTFDETALAWFRRALRESHADARRDHDEAVARLQAKYGALQNRVDKAYDDKLDGLIDAATFERRAGDWRAEQAALLQDIARHQAANQTYLEDGIRLLELAHKAHGLFARQTPAQKRRLLGFVVSNATWKDGKLTATWRQPFDLVADMAAMSREESTAVGAGSASRQDWLPGANPLHKHSLFVRRMIPSKDDGT